MDIKELGDICWSEASALIKTRRDEAREWAKAARSASENAKYLRAWPLLAERASIHSV
jgi:hypothetical protein